MEGTPHVRRPAVAGTFYPAGEAALEAALSDAFRDARDDPDMTSPSPPKAIVVPHAGYIYSGAVAASAYERVRPARTTIRRVVLLGPSHRVPLRDIAVPSVDAFMTPLGDVPIDRELRAAALTVDGVVEWDVPHADEHSLEVHLPFLQTVLDDFTLLPLVVGQAEPATVAAALDVVWGGDETLVVLSTDLSHYHDYATAQSLDQATAAAIAARRYNDIDDYDACGAYPLRGLLLAAERRGLAVDLIDLRNSGDTAGPRDRVVGYGAFAVR